MKKIDFLILINFLWVDFRRWEMEQKICSKANDLFDQLLKKPFTKWKWSDDIWYLYHSGYQKLCVRLNGYLYVVTKNGYIPSTTYNRPPQFRCDSLNDPKVYELLSQLSV